MKFSNIKALRMALVRYFGAPATSVSPQNGAEPHLTLMPGPFGYSASIEYLHPPWSPRPVPDPRPEAWAALKPPRDDGADGWIWETWEREMRAMEIPGWSPCRFAHRREGRAAFVFGVARGNFGLWKKSLDVCRTNMGDGTISKEQDVLTCVTHLRSGMGIGVFEKIETAAMACELADKAFLRWSEIAEQGTPLWAESEARVLRAWYELGIIPCTNAHCHEGDQAYAIYGMSPESVMDGRPEKLS